MEGGMVFKGSCTGEGGSVITKHAIDGQNVDEKTGVALVLTRVIGQFGGDFLLFLFYFLSGISKRWKIYSVQGNQESSELFLNAPWLGGVFFKGLSNKEKENQPTCVEFVEGSRCHPDANEYLSGSACEWYSLSCLECCLADVSLTPAPRHRRKKYSNIKPRQMFIQK